VQLAQSVPMLLSTAAAAVSPREEDERFLIAVTRSMSAHFHARSARERARNRSKSRTQAVTRGSPEIAVELRKRPLTCRSAFWPGPIPKLRLQVSNPKFCRLEWLFVPPALAEETFWLNVSSCPGPDGRAVEPLKRRLSRGTCGALRGRGAGRVDAVREDEYHTFLQMRSEASQAASSSATGSRACRMAAALF